MDNKQKGSRGVLKMASGLLFVSFATICLLPIIKADLTTEELQAFSSNVTIKVEGDKFQLLSKGIPNHETGNFPNSDNPNTVKAMNYNITFYKEISLLKEPGCLPMGNIGFAINGVPFFNPYTLEGYNAVQGNHAEIFDKCDGHPSPTGAYHYHKLPSCLVTNTFVKYPDVSEIFIGVALDGYPIYVTKSGNADGLDKCHGKTVNGRYRYYITHSFPYIIACYKGFVLSSTAQAQGQQPGQGGGGPPPGTSGQGQQPPASHCYYSNVTYPDGSTQLTMGYLNNIKPTGGATALSLGGHLLKISTLVAVLLSFI